MKLLEVNSINADDTHDRHRVITIAHLEHFIGELKKFRMPPAKILFSAIRFNNNRLMIDQSAPKLDGLFVCVEVLRPSQPNGVMSSAVSLPNHTFTGQA